MAKNTHVQLLDTCVHFHVHSLQKIIVVSGQVLRNRKKHEVHVAVFGSALDGGFWTWLPVCLHFLFRG
jgi:hypothetical protein